MSLYRQNALIQASQAGVLGDVFDYLELEHPKNSKRAELLQTIGEVLGFEQHYIDKAINTDATLDNEGGVEQ